MATTYFEDAKHTIYRYDAQLYGLPLQLVWLCVGFSVTMCVLKLLVSLFDVVTLGWASRKQNWRTLVRYTISGNRHLILEMRVISERNLQINLVTGLKDLGTWLRNCVRISWLKNSSRIWLRNSSGIWWFRTYYLGHFTLRWMLTGRPALPQLASQIVQWLEESMAVTLVSLQALGRRGRQLLVAYPGLTSAAGHLCVLALATVLYPERQNLWSTSTNLGFWLLCDNLVLARFPVEYRIYQLCCHIHTCYLLRYRIPTEAELGKMCVRLLVLIILVIFFWKRLVLLTLGETPLSGSVADGGVGLVGLDTTMILYVVEINISNLLRAFLWGENLWLQALQWNLKRFRSVGSL